MRRKTTATKGVKALVKQIRRDLTKLEAKAKKAPARKKARRKKASKRRKTAKRRTRR